MTVVSAMKFNEQEGAMIADEQSSTHIRKSDIATKIHEFKCSDSITALTGGSGASDILYEIVMKTENEIRENIKDIKYGKHISVALSQVMAKVKRKLIEQQFQSSYGLSEAELQCGQKITPEGRLTIESGIMQEYKQYASPFSTNTHPLFQNSFLVISYDNKEGIQISSVDMKYGKFYISRPYECIGSGSDMADNELNLFFENTPRENRNNIDPIEGIIALLYATDRAAARNIGVGGTPLIYILKKDEITIPSEENSRLAVEIVKGNKKGYLSTEFTKKSLQELIYAKANFKSIEQEMWTQAVDISKLSLLLRGYKV